MIRSIKHALNTNLLDHNDVLTMNNREISFFTKTLAFYFLMLITGALRIGIVGSLLKWIALLPVVVGLLQQKRVLIKKTVIYYAFYVFWSFLSIYWSINSPASINRTITHFSFLLLIIVSSSYTFSHAEIQFIKMALVWSSRVSALVVFISADYLYGRIYLGGIVTEDPNYLCGYFLFAVSYCISSLLSAKTKTHKLLLSVELGTYAYIIIGTGSRGGVLGVLVTSIITIMFPSGKKQRIFVYFLIRFLVLAITFVVISILVQFFDQNLMRRFSMAAITSDNASGRSVLWEIGGKIFSSSSFLRQAIGYGTGTVMSTLSLFGSSTVNVLHNMYLESLIEIGIVGFILYILFVSEFTRKAFKLRDTFSLSVILGMITLAMTLSIYTFKPYINILAFIICIDRKQNRFSRLLL